MRRARPDEAEGPASGFWARRRAAVAEEARREATHAGGAGTAPDAALARRADMADGEERPEGAAPGRSEEEILAALGLPDPDAMGAGDDFAAFMSRAVPAALRRRALRRLWTSRPVLANLDRLVDYDDDYTGGGVPMGSLRTAYTVGRGLLAQTERLAEEEDAPACRRGAVGWTSPRRPRGGGRPRATRPRGTAGRGRRHRGV